MSMLNAVCTSINKPLTLEGKHVRMTELMIKKTNYNIYFYNTINLFSLLKYSGISWYLLT